jgi:hypothetical protein
MGIKFEGEPPFYLGVAQTASAQVLDTTVVLRVTVSVPEIGAKPLFFIARSHFRPSTHIQRLVGYG